MDPARPASLRVLFVYPHCCHGGVETWLAGLIGALRPMGVASEACFHVDVGGSEMYRPLCPTYVLGSGDSRVVAESISGLLRRHSYDVVHQIASPQVYQAVTSSGFKGPVVATCHGNADQAAGMTGGNTAAVTVVSPELGEAVTEAAPDVRPELIPNGIGLERFRDGCRQGASVREALAIPAHHRIVARVGRVAQEKDIGLFLRTVACLVSSEKELTVCIAGGGETRGARQMLERAVRAAGLRDVQWIPIIPRDAMPAFYAMVRDTRGVVVIPSRTETCSMVALESMAAGIPVVAARVGGMVHLIEDGRTGILCTRSPNGLAKGIRRLLDDDDLYASITAAAEALVASQYSLEIVALEYLALYHRCLRDKGLQVSGEGCW